MTCAGRFDQALLCFTHLPLKNDATIHVTLKRLFSLFLKSCQNDSKRPQALYSLTRTNKSKQTTSVRSRSYIITSYHGVKNTCELQLGVGICRGQETNFTFYTASTVFFCLRRILLNLEVSGSFVGVLQRNQELHNTTKTKNSGPGNFAEWTACKDKQGYPWTSPSSEAEIKNY